MTLFGGGATTFQNLNIAGTEYLSGGPIVGGSLTWQPRSAQSLAIRADLAWTQHVLHTPRAGDGAKVDLLYIGPEVVFSFVNTERFSGGLAGEAAACSSGKAPLAHRSCTCTSNSDSTARITSRTAFA